MSVHKYFTEEKIKWVDEKYKGNSLENTWFFETPIDFEHKRYKLLAYLNRMEQNIKDGYLIEEFLLFQKRYKDIECFMTTMTIVNSDERSKEMISYIYKVDDFNELDNILVFSYDIMKKTYLKLLMEMKFIKDCCQIIETNIVDKRKKINIYIEKNNCSYYEHYIMGKSSIDREITKSSFKLDSKENFIFIKSTMAGNTIGSIIPLSICNPDDTDKRKGLYV